MTMDLDDDPSSVRTARVALQRLLEDEADVVLVRDAILLTSELVSNAVMHSGGPFRIHVVHRPAQPRIRVEVCDDSALLPEMAPERDPGTLRVGGAGLRLVDTVATRWGTELADPGKSVWFEID